MQIFLLDKQDLESIFTPQKLPVIPQGAGGTQQQVLAVVLFLKQCSHQHIPHWGLHIAKGLCTLGKCFQKEKCDGSVPQEEMM